MLHRDKDIWFKIFGLCCFYEVKKKGKNGHSLMLWVYISVSWIVKKLQLYLNIKYYE